MIQTWVEKEARKILCRDNHSKNAFILETGYGPSSLPHLGTAMEVVRTCMVAKFLRTLTSKKVIVVSFVDDMDGMRDVPPNLPNQELLKDFINFPLCKIPDPYQELESFSEQAIHSLKRCFTALDYTYSEYHPKSPKIIIEELNPDNKDIVIVRSSEIYQAGAFDEILLLFLRHHKTLLNIILPTLGEERQKTYSLFMPISPKTGKVLQEGVVDYLVDKGSVLVNEEGNIYEARVTGGGCKLQWKFDFVAHWLGMRVDYEMAGKDIAIGTFPVAIEVFKKFNSCPPVTMMYEMFLDEEGKKISKTKGNGIRIDQFLRYLGPMATKHLMFGYPESSKTLKMSQMPTYLDFYLCDLQKERGMQNPIWYIDDPSPSSQITAAMALRMVQGFRNLNLLLDSIGTNLNITEKRVIESMYNFYHEEYAPQKTEEPPKWLHKYIDQIIANLHLSEEDIKCHIYNLGKNAVNEGYVDSLREWFQQLYMCIFGYKSGPRLHSFFFRYGVDNSARMLNDLKNKSI